MENQKSFKHICVFHGNNKYLDNNNKNVDIKFLR